MGCEDPEAGHKTDATSPVEEVGVGEISNNVTNYIECRLHDSDDNNNLILILNRNFYLPPNLNYTIIITLMPPKPLQKLPTQREGLSSEGRVEEEIS